MINLLKEMEAFRKSFVEPVAEEHKISHVNNWRAVLAAAESTAYGDLSAKAFLSVLVVVSS